MMLTPTYADTTRWGKSRSDLLQLSVISVAMKNPGQFHHLSLSINCIDDTIFSLDHSKAGEASVSEMQQLFRVRRTRRATETQNFEEHLAETFGIGMAKIFECREDSL